MNTADSPKPGSSESTWRSSPMDRPKVKSNKRTIRDMTLSTDKVYRHLEDSKPNAIPPSNKESIIIIFILNAYLWQR